MHRRTFFTLTLAASAAPLAALAAPATYTEGLVKKHLAKGDTVFLDFKADWCSTCRAQEKAINALLKANPAYEKNVVFINVDWDQHGKGELSRSLNIPRRSTLVVLKGDKELGRIVAGTKKSDIENLMDTALAAATGN
ncbi:thioredoxin family protein [Shimia biformata]|uniref:thioredoxin family protein n=1 Tax=Shimia biformata TaxID=1294299 RepID=UPI001950113D|nr:thioredoxin family protein [Shimia biformata]